VTITATDSVSVTSGAQIGTEVLGQGKAGEVTITATNSVSLDGVGSNGSSGVVSQVLPRRIGNGNISIDTGSLSITNGAAISTTTKGKGDAGNVTITATNSVSLDGVSSNGEASRIQSEVYPQAGGEGGTIDIETGSLSVTNGAVISASTAGQKDAGTIQIKAREDVRISGDSRLETASFSSGEGGDIDIKQARSLFLIDGAQITSRSEGTGAAGDITIQTRENLESDRSQITATTQSGDGGNINLTVGDLLLMRNNSQISTTAGNAQAGGNGGNININTPFLVAVPIENSDITANAFTGTGGTVNITFAGIYGLEFRPRQTPKSDITASSEYGPQGTFEERNLTGIIAEQGLTNLPTEPVDRSRQITQNCRSSGATAREKNQFIITGRGGIPTSPNEPLQGEAVTTNWVTLDSDIGDKTTPATTPHSSTPKQLVEAQGWIVDDNGEIVLTTQALTVTPQGEWFSAAGCNPPQSANTPQG
jgi:large exoprotein involved in heme utilization and adhesion